MVSILLKNWKYIAVLVLVVLFFWGVKTVIFSTFVEPAVEEVSKDYKDSLSVERKSVKLLTELKLVHEKKIVEDSVFYKKQVEQLQTLLLQQKNNETLHKKTIEEMKDGVIERCYNCFGKEKPCK